MEELRTENVQEEQQMVMPKPNNNLILAIFTTICCCLPFGIVAIIKASKVDSLYMTKQYIAAQIAADEAKKWSYIGIAVGLLINILYGLVYFVEGLAVLSDM